MSQTFWAIVKSSAKGNCWFVVDPASTTAAVAAFTQLDLAERMRRELGPEWNVAPFDLANFLAFLRAFSPDDLRHVLFNPVKLESDKVITIRGDLAVIADFLRNHERGERPAMLP